VILASGDGHNGWLNSAAFRLLGVPRRTGALIENEWFALTPAITALAGTVVEDRPAIAAAVADAASRGIIGITDFELALGFRDWPERFARGMDLLRVRPAVYPDGLDAAISAGLRTGDPLEGTDALVTMGPLKIISDGSLNTRTAYCYEPYADTPRATTHGLEIALHAIGDAAVGVALDAFTATGASGGIEHAQLMCRSDIGRMASLGLRASVQPAHLLDDRDVTARCWPDRADRCFMFRSLLTAGVELALGSDAPVAALDPWLAMAAAVHRSGDERNPWNPAEALTAGEALAASTDGQPTLQVGSRGDVVLLNHDPLRAAAGAGDSAEVAAHLRRVGVAASLVAGRPTHLAL
jgi:predicted amidohydrolase YtcJ